MNDTAYTPGHSQNASDFMAQRSFASHGQFFAQYLSRGLSVLDCGCGPGSITFGIAKLIDPGNAVGVDFGESQIARAKANVSGTSPGNVTFQTADCYSLPFAADSFDRVFSHALFEHLSEPLRAMTELRRVLKPNGIVGLCSPDWGGFILSPPSDALTQAVLCYRALQTRNGGDVEAGRKLGANLMAAGFESVQMSARYECYPKLDFIGDYLALHLEGAGDIASARAFREWARSDGGMFAQAWVSAIARKPE
jgi:SAM-dependent methyltransferase